MPPRKTSAASTNTTTEISGFENEFGRLGAIVERLEGGNLPLEEMLKLYEEGMSLSQRLNGTLSQAELQVKRLSQVHEEMTSNAIETVEVEVEELEADGSDDEDPF